MSIRVQLTTSKKQAQAMLNGDITDYLNRKIGRNYSRVVNSLRQKIPMWIRSQPEIQSLLDQGVPGSLNAVFGLYNGDAARAVSDIIQAIKQSTAITINKINNKYQGDIEFNFQADNFANLLALNSGHVKVVPGPFDKNEADLHWLEWLLTRGDTIIIVGYTYRPGADGRSEGGIMTRGISFRVPPQYSGRLENNFITRAFSNRESEIQNIVKRLFE